jgi:hypothetical protein
MMAISCNMYWGLLKNVYNKLKVLIKVSNSGVCARRTTRDIRSKVMCKTGCCNTILFQNKYRVIIKEMMVYDVISS